MSDRIDLNCDMGEGVGSDAAVMPYVTSANIACGAHAGDESTMRATLLLAAQYGVAAGAHPGYPDRDGFGRHRMDMTPREIQDSVATQIHALLAIARTVGVPLMHVKPHGALYNAAAVEPEVARAIVSGVRDVDPGLALFGLAGGVLIVEAKDASLRAFGEAFADRAYEPDGTLTPRGVDGAVIDEPANAAQRALRMVTERRVRCRDGSDIDIRADTICIHGDTPNAAEIARVTRSVLDAAGVRVTAPVAPGAS